MRYTKLCEDWKKAKFAEYASKEKIDFEKLKEDLYSDFEETIKIAEEEGIFDEDDEEYRIRISKFLASINLKNIDFYM